MVIANYSIVIQGELGSDLRPSFEPALVETGDGLTTLHCDGLDQAALHQLLDRILTLGLTLVDVHRVDQAG